MNTIDKINVNGTLYSIIDTTYNNATTEAAGLMSAADKTKLNGIADNATANAGTITGITMNGTSKGSSGVVDLGTVITSHLDISGKADKTSTVSDVTYNSSTGNLQKIINGTTTVITSVVASGFQIIISDSTGLDTLSAIGGATLINNTTTGMDVFTF